MCFSFLLVDGMCPSLPFSLSLHLSSLIQTLFLYLSLESRVIHALGFFGQVMS